MILHKLLYQFVRHRDSAYFYVLQATDAIRWLEQKGVKFDRQTRILDLGCGHGVFGAELVKRGCQVTFADEENGLFPELANAAFLKINIDRDDLSQFGQYDLVVCSNVLEHLDKPEQFIHASSKLLSPQGRLFLSWTNWLSPWGGHEFSPFHYLGTRVGPAIYDKLSRAQRFHRPYVNLFPTYIGGILRTICQDPQLRILAMAPRYYTEFAFLLRIPIAREFLSWNCALLIDKQKQPGK